MTASDDNRVAFKIKTTAPKKYVVRPSSGVTDAKTSASVQVIMQAQKEYPPDFQNCKDKFMVQTIVLEDGEQVDKDTFNKDLHKDSLKEARLRVILDGPAAPPSPVPEASEHDEDGSRGADRGEAPGNNSTRLQTAYNDVASINKENTSLQSRLEKITRERDELRRTLDQVQLHGGSKGHGASDPAQMFRLSILRIIIVAVLAFLLGHYT
ncbi:hypothetical protein CEUSTIGMA_g12777.t1 [Chlamydomonas eustigma]|uniref:MSP domain-containing protein n=1 Tax=Chlamydomonas eustigma TaxID=1157962 RepID=A0A250XRC2_9CHLO|nr:hypothetical protein CEUSTIGMA_g12777.t1 [Chlamydomonas eustigma]|eukprot:GAX85360.1 hypothetical protein CEUSTIGMA_g12777.t1 [Chlamydomonas eustigma]